MRRAVPVEQRVAVAVYKLAHGASYRQLSAPLAVSPSLCQEICEEVNLMICLISAQLAAVGLQTRPAEIA